MTEEEFLQELQSQNIRTHEINRYFIKCALLGSIIEKTSIPKLVCSMLNSYYNLRNECYTKGGYHIYPMLEKTRDIIMGDLNQFLLLCYNYNVYKPEAEYHKIALETVLVELGTLINRDAIMPFNFSIEQYKEALTELNKQSV